MLGDFFYLKDRRFWQHLLLVALPIALQNLIASSLNLIDNILVGQLGDAAIGGLTLANQTSFLVVLFAYGICSSASVFAAQYFGAKKLTQLQASQGLTLLIVAIPTLIFAFVASTWSRNIMELYTKDPDIIAQAVRYLRISAWTFPLIGISFAFSMVLRSIGQVGLPLIMSIVAMIVNIFLSLTLIFGWLGFSAMGVAGAAIGTLIARVVETVGMIVLSLIVRSPNIGKKMFHFPRGFVVKFAKLSWPVLANDLGWALGITALVGLFASLGKASLAAFSIWDTASQFVNIFIFGSVNATAILVGQLIGQGKINQTRLIVLRSTRIGFLIGLILGIFLACLANLIPLAFNISEQACHLATILLLIFAVVLPFRSLLYHQTVGLFRGAGDTLFPMIIEVGGIWIFGCLPALLANVWFHLPVWGLFIVALCNEVAIALFCLRRFRTTRWIRAVH